MREEPITPHPSCHLPEHIRLRFWSRVQISDGCWLWTARTTEDGYGVMDIRAIKKAPIYAHRIAYYIANGHWPEPEAAHDCDNPPCVRPSHIFEATQRENILDMWGKGRGRTGDPRRGADNPFAQITDEQAIAIRTMYATGTYSQREVAETFSVSRALVCEVVLGKSWSHLNDVAPPFSRGLVAGESHPGSRLTQSGADDIRANCGRTMADYEHFAAKYGVSLSAVRKVVAGETWKATP